MLWHFHKSQDGRVKCGHLPYCKTSAQLENNCWISTSNLLTSAIKVLENKMKIQPATGSGQDSIGRCSRKRAFQIEVPRPRYGWLNTRLWIPHDERTSAQNHCKLYRLVNAIWKTRQCLWRGQFFSSAIADTSWSIRVVLSDHDKLQLATDEGCSWYRLPATVEIVIASWATSLCYRCRFAYFPADSNAIIVRAAVALPKKLSYSGC